MVRSKKGTFGWSHTVYRGRGTNLTLLSALHSNPSLSSLHVTTIRRVLDFPPFIRLLAVFLYSTFSNEEGRETGQREGNVRWSSLA